MIVGILLAAGSSTRFGGDKLLAELTELTEFTESADGRCLAEVACASLRPAVDRLIAVVRPGADELARRLAAAGAELAVFANANQGMGASLAHGVSQAPDADGWLIALADMPLVDTLDALRIADALRAGATIAVPVCGGKRGHPVGFAQCCGENLMALHGDHGARSILAANAKRIVEIPIVAANAWHDVDTLDDLMLARRLFSGAP